MKVLNIVHIDCGGVATRSVMPRSRMHDYILSSQATGVPKLTLTCETCKQLIEDGNRLKIVEAPT